MLNIQGLGCAHNNTRTLNGSNWISTDATETWFMINWALLLGHELIWGDMEHTLQNPNKEILCRVLIIKQWIYDDDELRLTFCMRPGERDNVELLRSCTRKSFCWSRCGGGSEEMLMSCTRRSCCWSRCGCLVKAGCSLLFLKLLPVCKTYNWWRGGVRGGAEGVTGQPSKHSIWLALIKIFRKKLNELNQLN